MTLTRPRIAIQSLSALICLFSGRLGLSLAGRAVPCLSCALVSGGCNGCVLRMGQYAMAFAAGQGAISGPEGLRVIKALILAIALMIVFGRLWCGWLCPLGAIQDALALMGSKLKLGPSRSPEAFKKAARAASRCLLAVFLLVPPMVELGLVHPDLIYAFCQLCPGGTVLPSLAGQTRRLSFDGASWVTSAMTSVSLMLTGLVLGLSLAVSRPWCRLCPLTAAHRLLSRARLVEMRRDKSKCVSCGRCEKACPLGEPFEIGRAHV